MSLLAKMLFDRFGKPALLAVGALAVVGLVLWRWQVLSDRADAAMAARTIAERQAQDATKALAEAQAEHARQMAVVAEEMAAQRQNATRLAEQIEELRRDPSYDQVAGDVLRRAVERLRHGGAAAGGDPGGADPGAGAPAALPGRPDAAGDAAADAGPGGGAARAP